MEFEYKRKKDKEARKIIANNLLNKYPDKIPAILEKDPKSKIQEIDKTKYLVTMDLTVHNLV